jgi:osmotically-inducible protein OsmY
VKTALAISKTVQAFDIDVDSRDGVVSLAGTVPSVQVEAAALEIASDVSGVTEVIDELDIDGQLQTGPGDESLRDRLADAEIKALVYEKLLRAEDVEAKRVVVVVLERVVTLSGSVDTALDKDNVEATAASVDGIEAITNELTIRDSLPRRTAIPTPDDQVASAVRERLREGVGFSLDRVTVDVRSGVVEIRGAVRSESEKQLVELLAGSVDGVVAVVNGLEVS